MSSAAASGRMIDASKPMKIACINDIHLDPNYTGNEYTWFETQN
jgi:hypothetical protein